MDKGLRQPRLQLIRRQDRDEVNAFTRLLRALYRPQVKPSVRDPECTSSFHFVRRALVCNIVGTPPFSLTLTLTLTGRSVLNSYPINAPYVYVLVGDTPPTHRRRLDRIIYINPDM